MSRVTNVILTAHVGRQDGSDPEIDSVNKFLREAADNYVQFVEVADHADGTKRME
jgi:3-phosphoglycerate kinase